MRWRSCLQEHRIRRSRSLHLRDPGATAPGYQQTVANFVAWGIPPNNIVEISELLLNMFGLNTSFQIGY